MRGSAIVEPVVGLDIGGANTKAAVLDGDGPPRTASVPYEIWRDPDGLVNAIADVVAKLKVGGQTPVALTTTAELADVFTSKREGVLAVLGAARRALAERWLRVCTTDGKLVELARAVSDPLRCAAANWAATAALLARDLPDAILVDCGGTTTDVIPVAGGRVVARGRTDLERLRAGELVYTGALRTNVAAIVASVPVGGTSCPVAAEQFAVAADAHLRLGHLSEAQCTCSFPDGRGVAPDEVGARLARVVCADPEQLRAGDLDAIAAAVSEAQVAAIAAALSRVASRVGPGAGVVAVGVGAFLARAAAARCGLLLVPPPAWLAGPGGDVAAATALSVLGRDG